MKDYTDLTIEERITFLTKILGIDKNEVDSFLNHALVLDEYGVLDQHEFNTVENIKDTVIDILVVEKSNFPNFKFFYSVVKQIVEGINVLEELKHTFILKNILDYENINFSSWQRKNKII